MHPLVDDVEITAKDGAGRYALRTFPERWHRVLNEGLRIRRRRRDVLDFARMVIADGHRLYVDRSRQA